MVEQFTGKTSCSIVTPVKAVSSLPRANCHGDLRQLCCTVVANHNTSVFVEGVFLAILIVHKNPFYGSLVVSGQNDHLPDRNGIEGND